MREGKIDRAVEVLADDYVRQSSHLDSLQVDRTFDRRGLTAEERAEALSRLAALGVHIGAKPVTGFSASRPIGFRRTQLPGSAELDLVQLYLRDIGKERLLAPEDEVSLARTIRAGNEARKVLTEQGHLLPPDSRSRLREEVRAGNEAFDKMMVANLRLVVSIAKRFLNRSNSLDLLDLIQEGTIGLQRAVQKFDHDKGFKFSTYATWWIRQAITRALADKGRTIRLPVHAVETLARITKAQRYLEATLARASRLDELAEYLEMSSGHVQALLDMSREPISLDAPILSDGEADEGSDLEEYLDVPSIFGDPAEIADLGAIHDVVREALSNLPRKERQVIEMRFGLDTDAKHTLEEVGHVFGVTRERIRQIESKTLGQLKSKRSLLDLHKEMWPPHPSSENEERKPHGTSKVKESS